MPLPLVSSYFPAQILAVFITQVHANELTPLQLRSDTMKGMDMYHCVRYMGKLQIQYYLYVLQFVEWVTKVESII